MRSLMSLAMLSALVAPVEAGQTSTRSWAELSQEVRPGWTVRMVLPDSTVVEGRPATFTAEALTMQVTKTSNAAQRRKGPITIPRDQVRTLDIRRNGSKGRLIGTLVPVATGAAVGGAAASTGGFLAAEVGAALFLIVGIAGGTAGYFIGRSVDRRFHTVTIAP